MIDIVALHIHYRVGDKTKVKVIKPTDQTSTLQIKKDIADAIIKYKLRDKAEYYYVVFEMDNGGDKPIFRTIIPKTLF